jgi:cytochrome c-type biogenesis protein
MGAKAVSALAFTRLRAAAGVIVLERIARTNPLMLGGLLLVGLVIASSWLVFPYFVQGQQMMRSVGDNARLIKAGGVSRYLTRELAYSSDLEITATYASDEYFQYVDRASVIGDLRPDRNFIFYVSETIHTSDLPRAVPQVTLHVGERVYFPAVSNGPANAQHHRVTVYSFPKRDTSGNLVDIEGAGSMRVHVANRYMESDRPVTFVGEWRAPFELPEDLKSRSDITPVAVLALGAGLLSSVLTPCLLQLVVMFGGVIAGFTTVPGESRSSAAKLTAVVRRKIMGVALAFVLGFIVLYALAGALIGAVGHQAQLIFAEWSRTVAVVSGLIVIGLGIWVAARGTRDVACRIPNQAVMSRLARGDIIGTSLASMGYALGCTACFGGAIVATLIVYVGGIGSATIGAGIMLTFGIGVAIPFLLAAWYITKVDAIIGFLARNARKLSYASAGIIIAFGLILVTDNFHTVSDMIYPYLGLS